MRKRIAITGAIIGNHGRHRHQPNRPDLADLGIDPLEAKKPLPGDELVPSRAPSRPARSPIDAPPAAVWPWLVQMGYGRAGWYSYDPLDMRGKSVERILSGVRSRSLSATSCRTARRRVRGSRRRTGPGARPVQRHGRWSKARRQPRRKTQERQRTESRRPASRPRAASLRRRRRTSPPAGPSCSSRSMAAGLGSSSASGCGSSERRRASGSARSWASASS